MTLLNSIRPTYPNVPITPAVLQSYGDGMTGSTHVIGSFFVRLGIAYGVPSRSLPCTRTDPQSPLMADDATDPFARLGKPDAVFGPSSGQTFAGVMVGVGLAAVGFTRICKRNSFVTSPEADLVTGIDRCFFPVRGNVRPMRSSITPPSRIDL